MLIFFQITSKNEGLSDVNRVYTSAHTLKSLPLLGSDFCIQIMGSYLDKVLEMIKRGRIQIYILKKKSRSRCQLTHLCIFWKWVEDMHVHFIRTFKEFSTFYCGYVSRTTLKIKKILWSLYSTGIYAGHLDSSLQSDLTETLFNLTERYLLT